MTHYLSNPVFAKAFAAGSLIAGSLDLLSAFAIYGFWKHIAIARILQSIASGLLGMGAYSGGWLTALLGLALHYIIAASFTAFYLFLFNRLFFLRRGPVLNGLLFGIFVWVVMNLAVLPLSRYHVLPLTLQGVCISLAALMLCIGLPIALVAAYYSRKTVSQTNTTNTPSSIIPASHESASSVHTV